MSAKEMFEALGYKYIWKIKGIIYRNDTHSSAIQFNTYFKNFRKTSTQYQSTNYAMEITMQELQAIYQQCKELGWLEEEESE